MDQIIDKKQERRQVQQMIQTTVKKHGFESVLYRGIGTKEKAVIVMSGSNGGMRLTEKEARFYHDNGIPALALALFKTKQTQKNLDRVPIEYVERAVRWLKRLGYQKIGIDGASKGSEIALLAGSMFPDITCVIARVPSYFVSEGLRVSGISKNPSGTSCWNYHGKELPFAPYRSRKFNMLKMLMKEKELHILTFNRGKIVTPETTIPVEKINGPILLLSSKHDEVWESYKSAVLIEKRLNQASFPFAYRHIAFPYLSHAMMTDFSPMYKMIFKRERYFPKECAAEREQLKHELLNWINHIW